MTLNKFLEEYKNKLKLAKKLIVRDLDQTDKDTFVAYVDENKDSFDVQIVFDSKKNIMETNCDCENGGICNHIIALAYFLSEEKTEKVTIKKTPKKKLTEIELVLETVSNDDLRLWLAELLKKNKEIAFIFKNEFDLKSAVIDEATIKKTIQDCISSVIGKRRRIETNELKKVTDSLQIALKPIEDFIFSTAIDGSKYKLVQARTNELVDFKRRYYISSPRVTKLIENIYNNLLLALFNIKDFEVWQTSMEFYYSLLFNNEMYTSDIELCRRIYENSKSNEIQKNAIARFVEQKFNAAHNDAQTDYLGFNDELENLFLNIFLDNDLFAKHYSKFRPRRYHNDYNCTLIAALIKCGQFDKAEEYCIEQINRNVNESYDMPYVNFLIGIYEKKNDVQKLASLLINYGKYIYDIEKYHFIKANASPEKFKKYRQSVLSNARYALQNGNVQAFEFYYDIKKLDGKSSELLQLLKSCSHIEIIDKYKEVALKIDAPRFVKDVCTTTLFYGRNEECITNIATYIYNSVDRKKLKFYFSSLPIYGGRNMIFRTIEKLMQ
ncbi:SWIM zinc finger family protein [Flavobacterium sp.]|uniref:SWIM zinc finger family protein n=1 Tax=Flavobacterium sp. TaxID=239 RepID=UPI002611DDFE|nr:SWIM zinc finger family protein [Flavobacterium sp.]